MLFFFSMSRSCSFLEREEGVQYSAVFNCLRLHGITDSKLIDLFMNVKLYLKNQFIRELQE